MMRQIPTGNWCQSLGITQPRLEAVTGHPAANTFALLLVALLERGEAMSLAEVAARFEEAGIAERSRALLSLQRCKPARPPVYREGDLYHLDPYDDELDLWVFRLGLRPPKVARTPPKVEEPTPLPDLETPLTLRELDEAWKGASLFGLPAFVRLAPSIHGGTEERPARTGMKILGTMCDLRRRSVTSPSRRPGVA